MPAVDLSDAVIEYLALLADKDGGYLVARQLRSQSYQARGLTNGPEPHIVASIPTERQ